MDRLGQAAGDEALREVALILQKQTRAIDASFRVAADDFAIVMPGTSAEGARVVAERCRTHITEAKLCDGTVTTSIGIVEALGGEESADDIAARATAAVGADKQAQRS